MLFIGAGAVVMGRFKHTAFIDGCFQTGRLVVSWSWGATLTILFDGDGLYLSSHTVLRLIPL